MAVPHLITGGIAIAALPAGKHQFIGKPKAQTAGDAIKVSAAARLANNRFIHPASNRIGPIELKPVAETLRKQSDEFEIQTMAIFPTPIDQAP